MNTQPYRHDPGILVLDIDDSINDDTSDAFINDLIAQVEAGPHRRIVGDCTKLEFLSSFGLSVLLRLRTALNAAGGELRLCNVSVLIQRLFEASKVSKLFPEYSDIEKARLSFTSNTR